MGSPSRQLLIYANAKHVEDLARYQALALAKRPTEELYDLRTDPDQVHNLAGEPERQEQLLIMRQQLSDYLKQQRDPREQGRGEFFDKLPAYSPK